MDLQIPSEEINRYYTEQDKSYRLQRRTFWSTVATFLAVAAYALITLLQWHTMDATFSEIRKQAKTAQSALDKNIESFRIDERAWVEIETVKLKAAYPPTPGFNAWSFKYELYPKNAGKTVARDVVARAGDILGGTDKGIQMFQDGSFRNRVLENESCSRRYWKRFSDQIHWQERRLSWEGRSRNSECTIISLDVSTIAMLLMLLIG